MANEHESNGDGGTAVAEAAPHPVVEVGRHKFNLAYMDDCIELADDERKGLKESIKEHGILTPIIVNKVTRNVCNGRNRLEIALELQLPVEQIPIRFIEEPNPEMEQQIAINLLATGRGWNKTARRFTVRRLKEKGLSTNAIAKAMRVVRGTIQNDLEKLGLKEAPPSRSRPGKTKAQRLTRQSSINTWIENGLDWCGGFVRMIDHLGMPKKYHGYIQEMKDWLVEAQEKNTKSDDE